MNLVRPNLSHIRWFSAAAVLFRDARSISPITPALSVRMSIHVPPFFMCLDAVNNRGVIPAQFSADCRCGMAGPACQPHDFLPRANEFMPAAVAVNMSRGNAVAARDENDKRVYIRPGFGNPCCLKDRGHE